MHDLMQLKRVPHYETPSFCLSLCSFISVKLLYTWGWGIGTSLGIGH